MLFRYLTALSSQVFNLEPASVLINPHQDPKLAARFLHALLPQAATTQH
jgi:hypothetical protein